MPVELDVPSPVSNLFHNKLEEPPRPQLDLHHVNTTNAARRHVSPGLPSWTFHFKVGSCPSILEHFCQHLLVVSPSTSAESSLQP